MTDNLVFDDSLIRSHIPIIVESWQNRSNWLKNPNPPEVQNQPSGIGIGSREHANYLLIAGALSRFGKTADEVIGLAKILAEEFSNLIDPLLFPPTLSTYQLEILNKAFQFGNENGVRIKGWFNNLQIIRDEFDGDPRNLFLGIYPEDSKVESIMEARKSFITRFVRFYGFQHKITQLVIPWFQVVPWEEYPGSPGTKEEWGLMRLIPAIPVDHWFMKMTRQFGWVKGWKSDHRDRIARPISDHLCQICLEEGYNCHDFAQAMWHIGARFCADGRKMCNPDRFRTHCFNCPADKFCLGVVPTNWKYRNGRANWNLMLPRVKTLFDQ